MVLDIVNKSTPKASYGCLTLCKVRVVISMSKEKQNYTGLLHNLDPCDENKA